MANITVKKGLIGQEDINLGTGTFSRAKSDGSVQTITKVNAEQLITLPAGTRTVSTVTDYLANGAVHNVKDYGATGDGTTDDAAAIQLAIDAAEVSGGTVHLPAGTYAISSTLVVLACDILAARDATVSVAATLAVGLHIGSAATSCDGQRLQLPRFLKATQQWTKDVIGTDRGVVVRAADSCLIEVAEVKDFSYGLVLEGDAQGVAYNTVNIFYLTNNAVNLYLDSVNSGWANQNVFIGGRFTIAANGASARISGARQIQLGSSVDIDQPDTNTFVGCSLEGDYSEYCVECWGLHNQFINCRWESTTNDCAIIWRDFDATRYAQSNQVLGGFDLVNVTVTEETNARYNGLVAPTVWEADFGGGGGGIARLSNRNNDGEGIRLYQSPVVGKTADTDYQLDLSANFLKAKAEADSYDRVLINNALGRIYLGAGSTDPTSNGFLRWSNGGFNFSAPLSLSDGPTVTAGAGTPEAAVTADVGSMYLRTDGGASTSLYIKETGTGNTGWVAK